MDGKRNFRKSNNFWQVGGPVPLEVFFDKVEQRLDDIRIVRDKALIKIGKAEEESYILDFSWS